MDITSTPLYPLFMFLLNPKFSSGVRRFSVLTIYIPVVDQRFFGRKGISAKTEYHASSIMLFGQATDTGLNYKNSIQNTRFGTQLLVH